MRHADPGGASIVRDSGPVFSHDLSASYEVLRLRDPTYRAAKEAFCRAIQFERAHSPRFRQEILESYGAESESDWALRETDEFLVEALNPATAVRNISLAVNKDDTAVNFRVGRRGRGCLAAIIPKLIAALRAAMKNGKAQPALAADAHVVLASLAQIDSGLGNMLSILNGVLEPPGKRLRRHLSCEATAVSLRASALRAVGSNVAAIEDNLNAYALATQSSDCTGLAWSFAGHAGDVLFSAGLSAKALLLFEESADGAYSALQNFPVRIGEDGDGSVEDGPVCPKTGGRERDPRKLSKVVEFEFGAAAILLGSYLKTIPQGLGPSVGQLFAQQPVPGTPKSLLRRGLSRYKSAIRREANLPKAALRCPSGEYKVTCQHMLSILPMTKRSQGAINAGGVTESGSTRSFVECHGCGSLEHGGLRSCSGCLNASYCSKTCQTSHWKEHRVACRKAAADAAK